MARSLLFCGKPTSGGEQEVASLVINTEQGSGISAVVQSYAAAISGGLHFFEGRMVGLCRYEEISREQLTVFVCSNT